MNSEVVVHTDRCLILWSFENGVKCFPCRFTVRSIFNFWVIW